MKKLNKLMAAVLALVLCLSLLPMSAFAAPAKECEHNFYYEDNLGVPGINNYHTVKCRNCDYWDIEAHVWGEQQTATYWRWDFSSLTWQKATYTYRTCTLCGDADSEVPNGGQTNPPDTGKCPHGKVPAECPTCNPQPVDPSEHVVSYKDNLDGKTHAVVCSVEGCQEHKGSEDHDFGAAGVCKCGATSDSKPTEPTESEGKTCKYGHTMEYSVSREATCKETGLAKWDCSKNGCNESEEVILDKLPHEAETTVSDITETNHTYKCKNCGAVVTDEPHTWVLSEHKDATCTEKGCDKYVCKHASNGCTAVKTDETDAKGHEFAGACVEKDENGHVYLCKNGCGEYGDYAPHSFGEWYTSQEPTCVLDGLKVRECKDCGYKDEEVVKATGHKDDDGDGTCDDCDADLICKHPNKVAAPAKDVAATCQHKGLVAYECPDCGSTIYEDGAEMLEHSYTGEFSDKEDGTHAQKCVNGCEQFGNPQAHGFGAWEKQEDGSLKRACTDCDAEQTHVHTDDGTPADNGDGTHTSECTDPNCPDKEDSKVTEDHVDEDDDGICDDCGATMPGNGGGTIIPEPDVPLAGGPDEGDTEIDDVEVPLAGLMTRAEFVSYLWYRENGPESELSTFSDVPEDHEYAQAIGWAQANGIAKGIGDNEFAPDDLVTVEQALLFLERYAEFKGIEMPVLNALIGKEPDEILDNADEVLAEFFGEEYVAAEEDEAA